MRNCTWSTWIALTFGALLMAGVASAHDEARDARSDRAERAVPGLIDRQLTRLQHAVARFEARLAGRGSSMQGCADMMAGGGMMDGGMMGGSRPNEGWRSPQER